MHKLLFFSMLTVSLSACKEENGGPSTQNFDRSQMLAYYADAHLQPGYDSLAQAAAALHGRLEVLPPTAQSSDLMALRAAWLQSYQVWQRAANWSVGPAAAQGLRKSLAEELGTFPVSGQKIEQKIAAGDTAFVDFDRDSRGLFAIEYLLFAGSAQEVIDRINQPASRSYLQALGRHFSQNTEEVRAAWPAFRGSFVASDGTSAGSSTVQLYNAFLLSYEGLKNFKLGLPLGLRMGQNQAEPQKVEAYYSGQSLRGIALQMQALEAFWRGDGTTGFRNYLLASAGGDELVARTEQELRVIEARIADCGSGRLDSLISHYPQPAIDLHTALQRNTRFFKSDMSSLLGLTITFSSGDGD